MTNTRIRGTLGEDFAAERLRESGYEILERGFRHGRSEIDIIARKGCTVAFIEVKTRAQNSYGTPAEAVSAAQRRRIVQAAAAYLWERGIYNTGEFQPRFDLFEVVTERPDSPRVIRFCHMEGAFDTEGLGVSL